MAAAQSAMAGTGTRSWATRAGTRRTVGARTPAAVVRARALWMASMRVAIRSVERTWWARQKPATVVRRARGAALRVGQRRRKSPKIAGAFLGHQGRTCGQELVSARVTRRGRRTW